MTHECSTVELQLAIEGSLAPDREQALYRHLDQCEACRTAMGEMAGLEPWCKEAARLLVTDELDEEVPSREQWSEVDFTVEHLEPSDEPNVLGRLGGYDVLEVVGRGGMSVVLKAHDRELNRYVAIKVLAPHLAQSSLARKRFAREAQAAAAVVHPNVMAIHQVQANGPLPFLVMPLVAGESLAHRLEAQGRLELKETLRIGMQAAAALAAAHEQGLVHRDVKPSNIMLEKGVERAVLTDFGLARAADDVSMTRWGIIVGTPQYMSPEQARGEPVDGRSDLFSLGCVLYEVTTGISPFRADSTAATLRRLTDDAPPAMSAQNPELPPWIVAIVDRMLEKDPSRRFSSAKEVSELLEGCLAHMQQPTSVPLPNVAGTLRVPSAPNSPLLPGEGQELRAAIEHKPRLFAGWSRRKRVLAAAIGLLFFGGLGLAGIIIHLKKDNKTTTIEVPEGSTAHVDSKGDVTLELASSAAVTDGKPGPLPISDRTTIRPLDVLQFRATGIPPDESIDGYYGVEPDGNVAIGPTCGRVNVGGLNFEQAEAKIVERLKAFFKSPTVQVTFAYTNPPWHVATVPRQPYTIQPFDVLTIWVVGTPHDNPIDNHFIVEAEGTVALGPEYGRVQLKGLNLEEAEEAITKKLKDVLVAPKVQVTLSIRESPGVRPRVPYRIKPNDLLYIVAAGMPSDEPISGIYAVEPRGTVPLGASFGRVNVQGLSLEVAEKAIQTKLKEIVKEPEVSVTVGGWIDLGTGLDPFKPGRKRKIGTALGSASGYYSPPIQAPRVGPAAPPRVPFVLSPVETTALDSLLADWETRNKQIRVLESKVYRWRYGSRTLPPPPDEGELKFAAPHKAWMMVAAKDQKQSEQWLCDAKSIFQWDFATKTVHESVVPLELLGKCADECPVPFVFGVEAKKLKQRYFMRIITPPNVRFEVWLEAYPKFARDAARYKKVNVILQLVGPQTVFATAIEIYLPNGMERVVYELKDPKINPEGVLSKLFDKDWTKPSIPAGWSTTVVHTGNVTYGSTPPASDAHSDNPLTVDARRNKQRYVATMRMLEAKLRANYEQIKTWSGAYELKEGSKERSNNSWVERKILVQYAIDMRHNRLFTTYEQAGTETVTNLGTKKVRQIPVAFPFTERYVLTGEHWLKSTPAPGKNETENATGMHLSRGKGVNSAYRKKRDEANEYMTYSSVVDPRRFFCESEIPFWDFLRMDSEWLEAGKPLPMKIGEARSKSGVNYSLTQEYRPGGAESTAKPTVGVSLFDSAAGYQVTSDRITRPDGKTESESEWKYTLVSGVYLPQRYHLRKYLESGELELEREFTSVDAKLNEPIAEDRFGWNALGLQEGDQILDEIDSATFRYHDGKVIPAAEYIDKSAK